MKFPMHRTMLVLGTTLAAFTIATPYRNGAWLDPATSVTMAGLSLNLGYGPIMAILHLAKVSVVASVARAWRQNRWVGAVCACAATMLVGMSIFNAWKVLERQRSARVVEERAAVLRAKAIDEELRAVRERVALLGWRPLATVEAEIAAERASWIWDVTAGCTKLESGTHRKFCANDARLEGARAQAAQAEKLRQREAELAGARLDRPAVAVNSRGYDDDMLQAILIAVAIELTEVVLFGLAGYFVPPSVPVGSPSPRGGAPIGTAPRTSRGGRRSRAGRASSHTRTPGAAAPNATSAAASDGHDEARWRTTGSSRPRDEPCATGGIGEERRRAIDAFVASLRRGVDLRATGSELFDAYAATCVKRGWPPIPRNVFGELLLLAIDGIGGRKVKASRQYYCGVGLPCR